jgi:hypothetical protein
MTPPRSREIRFDPPYDQIFHETLAFATLTETENTLLKLEELRQRFLAASDKKGVDYCHALARMGRERATMVAKNPRVKPENRSQKQESALWFQIWLETPDLFADWLALRKQRIAG